MNRFTIVVGLILSALLVLLAISSPAPGGDGFGSNVRLRMPDGGFASGVLVAPDRVLTVRHAIGNYTEARGSFNGVSAPLTFLRSEGDLALLHVDPAPGRSPVEVSCNVPHVGDTVKLTGWPRDMVEITVSAEVISAPFDFPPGAGDRGWPGIVAVFAPAIPGMSGGAALDLRGRLVGMTLGRMIGFEPNRPTVIDPIGFLATGEAICAFLGIAP